MRILHKQYGSVVKRLRHRPFTAVTRVQFPSESLKILQVGLVVLSDKYADVAQWQSN